MLIFSSMKTTPWGRRNNGLSRGAWWGVAVAACFVFLVLVRLVAPNLFLSLFAPAFSLSNNLSVSVGEVLGGFTDVKALAGDNAMLAEENAALSLANRTLSEKVRDLTALLGSEAPTAHGIVAGVLARPPVAAYDTLVLSVGTDIGVALGMEAYGAGGIPLGLVSSATADFSRVTLFSAPGVSVAAWAGNARIPVTLVGAGAGAYTARVPQDSGVVVGDAVFVPGPGAIPVGTVIRVGGGSSDPLATLFIRPAVNLFSITWVTLRDTGSAVSAVRLDIASISAP